MNKAAGGVNKTLAGTLPDTTVFVTSVFVTRGVLNVPTSWTSDWLERALVLSHPKADVRSFVDWDDLEEDCILAKRVVRDEIRGLGEGTWE